MRKNKQQAQQEDAFSVIQLSKDAALLGRAKHLRTRLASLNNERSKIHEQQERLQHQIMILHEQLGLTESDREEVLNGIYNLADHVREEFLQQQEDCDAHWTTLCEQLSR